MAKKQIVTNEEIEKDIITALKNPHKQSKASYRRGWVFFVIGLLFLVMMKFIYPDFLVWVIISGFVYAIGYPIFFHIRRRIRIKKVSICDYEIKTGIVSNTYSETYIRRDRHARRRVQRINNYTLYFGNGKKWDLPKDNYLWSVEYPMSDLAIYNSSHRGDEFIVVTKKKTGKIVMAYNTEFFEYQN